MAGSLRLYLMSLTIGAECRSLGVIVMKIGKPYVILELKTRWLMERLTCRVPGLREDMKR